MTHLRAYPQESCHLVEVFVKVSGKLCYLWRAVDHEGEVLAAVVTARRDKAAAVNCAAVARGAGLIKVNARRERLAH